MAEPAPAGPRYWTIREAATRYQVSADTIRRWIAKGAITPTRVWPGPRPRVRLSDEEVRKLAR